jgi:hypothetical protein
VQQEASNTRLLPLCTGIPSRIPIQLAKFAVGIEHARHYPDISNAFVATHRDEQADIFAIGIRIGSMRRGPQPRDGDYMAS